MREAITSIRQFLAPRPPAPVEASTSKAGRNLRAAIPTAIVLLVVVGLSAAFQPAFFALLVTLCVCIGLWEAAGAFLHAHIRIRIEPLWMSAVAMTIGTWFAGISIGTVIFLIAAFGTFLWHVAEGHKHSAEHGLIAIFALAWVAYLGCYAVALARLEHSFLAVCMLVCVPAAADTGAWGLGVLVGKHKMCPKISPKKTWEGFFGAVLGGALVALPLGILGFHMNVFLALLVAVCGAVVATLGDLCESILKRDVGVKDMGSLFPGHGGMLDRVDSILMWAPFCFVFLSLA